MTITDIFVHKLSISPFDEEVFAQIVLETFDNNKIGEPVLIDLLKVAPLGFLQHCLTLLKNTSTKTMKREKTFNFVNDFIERFA